MSEEKNARDRRSGILVHITSLYSPLGIGDLGPEAYRFADFLLRAGQSFWQILPLNPTDPAYDNSPYFSISALAGNPLVISPELLIDDGLLTESEVEAAPDFPQGEVDFNAVIQWKRKMFSLAHERFQATEHVDGYESFCSENEYWLDDFTLFVALKDHFRGVHWSAWPLEIRDRHPDILQALREEHRRRIDLEKFLQYLFRRQWIALKSYCNERGLRFIGDIPIYVAYDSVDVWTNAGIFKLDEARKPVAVSGVPPDYFSETGQLWGNPVYDWEALRSRGFDWWVRRMEHTLDLYDVVRIDHFRGLVAYWEIKAGEKTAINGQWVQVPIDDFLSTMLNRFSPLPIIAEDLGIITPDVKEVMSRFNVPGMKVLLFAFGDDDPNHPYLPHTYQNCCVVYTGTHDTNTLRGWFEKETRPEEKKRIFRYLGRKLPVKDIHWEFVRLALMSVADLAIFPLQDILGLGEEARMNQPATRKGNWKWQLEPDQLTPDLSQRLGEMTRTYGRMTDSVSRG
jgi:4-alpha-glucanotransferase